MSDGPSARLCQPPVVRTCMDDYMDDAQNGECQYEEGEAEEEDEAAYAEWLHDAAMQEVSDEDSPHTGNDAARGIQRRQELVEVNGTPRLRVQSVTAGGSAEAAGIQAYDEIIAIDGEPMPGQRKARHWKPWRPPEGV